MSKSEVNLGSAFYILSYLLLPYLISILGTLFSIPQWCCKVIVFFLNFVISLLIFRRFLLKNGKAALGALGKFLGYTALGLVFYYTSSLAVSYLTFLLRPDFTNLNDASIVSLAEKGGIWIAVSSVIFAPLAEELLVRGLLFHAVHQKCPVLAWFLSAGVFSAAHIVGYIGSYDIISFLLAFLQYLPAGFCLAYAYKSSGTILAPILMHTVINLISITILL